MLRKNTKIRKIRKKRIFIYNPSLLSAEAGLYRSEGFPLTCYFIPGRDGAGVWTFGNLRHLAFRQETHMFLKLTKRTHIHTQVQLLVNILKHFGVLTPYL